MVTKTVTLLNHEPDALRSQRLDEPSDINALEFVVRALRVRAPDILTKIHTTSGDDKWVVTEWARTYHLNSTIVVEHLIRQRHHWRKYPHHARGLTLSAPAPFYSWPASGEDEQWVKEHLHASSLPNPSAETLAQWLERARGLYRSRPGRHTRPRWKAFARQCDVFVQSQVQGLPPGQIATAESIDRKAVVVGINRVADLLSVQLRLRRRGRPLRKT